MYKASSELVDEREDVLDCFDKNLPHKYIGWLVCGDVERQGGGWGGGLRRKGLTCPDYKCDLETS